MNEFNASDDEDGYNDDTDVEGEDDDDDDENSDEDIDVFYYPDDEPLEQVLEEIPVCIFF